jgi:hypothetical protein
MLINNKLLHALEKRIDPRISPLLDCFFVFGSV